MLILLSMSNFLFMCLLNLLSIRYIDVYAVLLTKMFQINTK